MPTFFALLPDDVHDRIAHYLFSATRYVEDPCSEECFPDSIVDDSLLDTLLEYARNSPVQCRSVARAMSKHLFITGDWRIQRAVDWIFTLAHHLQILEISEAPPFYLHYFPGALPQFPNLERAVIDFRRTHMLLIQGSPKLSNLTVVINDLSQGWDILVSTVDSLQLRALKLVFIRHDTLSKLSRVELMSLSAVCPSVEALHLDTIQKKLPSATWDMIKAMPSLKQLKLNGHIEEEHVPFVQSLQEIGLLDSYHIEKATRFGPALTHLSFNQTRDQDLMGIELLPNLRHLEIKALEGHERDLIGIINNVETLALSWHDTGCFHSFDGQITDLHAAFYEPDEDVLDQVLTSATQLKSLHINNAILSSGAITRLLKIVGGRLEAFEICHDWQKEPVPTRMERILQGIARYCPNLETLTFLERPQIDFDEVLLFATQDQKKRCLRALEEVAAAAPGFRSYRHVRSTILHRFTDPLRGNAMTWYDMLEIPCPLLGNSPL